MRVLVAAWVGSTNLGDELLLRSIVRRLRPNGVEVEAISLAPASTRATHGIDTVGHRDVPGILAAVDRADAVLFGGGDLLQDVTSPWSLPFHLSRVVAARLWRRPIGGIGLGAPPLVRRGSAWAIRRAWPNTAPIAVRDQRSHDTLARLGITSLVAADLAFGLPAVAAAPRDEISVCLRPWHGGGRARARSSWERGLHDPLLPQLAGALDELAARTGLGLRFVAMQPDRDGPYHQRLAEHLRTGDVTLAIPDLEGVVAEVGGGRLVVASRFHALVCGLLAGRPVVGLSYASKVTALASRAPASVRALSLDDVGIAALVAQGRDHLEAATRREDVRSAELASLKQAQLANNHVIDRLLHR